MTDDSPPPASRPPHPLAVALIERLRERHSARVLEIGAGSGRNTVALQKAGFEVVTLRDAPPPCAAALSTHDLLHGTPRSIAARLDSIAGALEAHAPLYATFGSVHDARYGIGEEREPHVFASSDGDEAGVPHVYFDRERLQRLIERRFSVEALDETSVDEVAGRWAHERAPLRGAVHWFALLRLGASGVRAARPNDARAWLEMRGRLWPEADRAELGNEIDRHFAAESPSEHVFVYAVDGANLAGMLELSLRSHADACTASPVPFIKGWFVHAHARRRGLGAALLRAAEQWALAHGFSEIASDTQIDNHLSLRAHAALGFDEVERAVHLRKRLIAGE